MVEERSVTLILNKMGKKVRARGSVLADNEECAGVVPVGVQKKIKGNWKTVRSLFTNSAGDYSASFKSKKGRFRAVAPEIVLGPGHFCGRTRSPMRKVNA